MLPSTPRATLFLDPLSYHLERDNLFDPSKAATSGERILEPFVLLRERLAALGVATHTGDLIGSVTPTPVNLYATLGIRSRWRALSRRDDFTLSAFFVNECPVAEPRIFQELPDASRSFERLYSFADDEAMSEFTSSPLHYEPFRYPYPFTEVEPSAWAREDRSFLTMINGNKVPRLQTRELYTERMRAVAYFEARGEIDLYGVGWDGPPFRVGETSVPKPIRRAAFLAESRLDALRPNRDPLLAASRRAWRGSVVSKSETLSGYAFAICFENMILDGWVTEKIFDCLRAGAVPVYLGAPDVDDWIDVDAFIDMRKFASYDALREYLKSLGPTELRAYREAGREYLHSERFAPFTKDTFVRIFEDIVSSDAPTL